MKKGRDIKKVLILGSGGLKIGQAGEFDYSGSQAIKALKEEGVASVIVNPNIATIQTSEGLADRVYFLPVTEEFVEKVIEKERPDGILLSFGGQTALNCGLGLEKSGVLKKYGVRVLGTPVSAIRETEDRDLFVKRLAEIGVRTPASVAAASLREARRAAERIGYPLMVRAAYALGGRGSGLCRTSREFEKRCKEAFSISPQVLVEEWLGGWKEIEYEVVRDRYDNCITVCNMENLDPLGIHTGESIVVAPSQTLDNTEYHMLRETAIRVVRHLGVIGECNIQYALDPASREYRVIEVNARLSRSSALASKATGYPLAAVAAKLALGHSLTEIRNAVTKRTFACFEPALDYVVVKVPRWDLKKFKEVDESLGSEMKSVGEVMSIGRSFEEALQKAFRMVDVGVEGITGGRRIRADEGLERMLERPTDKRMFAIVEAFRRSWTVERVHELTNIDTWFLAKIRRVVHCDVRLGKEKLTKELLKEAKMFGFSDARIATLTGRTEEQVRMSRKRFGIIPAIKQIDTLAAEYPAETNYLYMTYNGSGHDVRPSKKKSVLVLGGGVYRIGSSVEFDWCCVGAARTARELGYTTIMLNYNPETVSTDHDICDRLYFDEMSTERIRDIYEFEHMKGVIVSMGGQTPNNRAIPLARAGVPVLGTDPGNIDRAEDRHKFSALLDRAGIDQPRWKELSNIESAKRFARKVGYPVLIRPSYVLSGAAMNVVWNEAELTALLKEAAEVNPEHPVVITEFIRKSKEIEIDAVAKDGEMLIYAISEHVENAGVHSGDATVVFPGQKLYIETVRQVKQIARAVAKELAITGPFNMQFLAYKNKVQVIECNVRASRSFPFCSKVFKYDMIALATKAILGERTAPVEKSSLDLDHVGVKVPQFSFSRLKGADPVSGVEMASTGEVGCIGREFHDAFLKAMLSVGFTIPKKNIFISAERVEDQADLIPSAAKLRSLGYTVFTTRDAAEVFREGGVRVRVLGTSAEKEPAAVLSAIENKKMDLVVNLPHENGRRYSENDHRIRRCAVDHEVPLVTNMQLAKEMVEALSYHRTHESEIEPWDVY